MNFADITKAGIILLKKRALLKLFRRIDNEIEKKKVVFSRRETVRDDLYD